MFLSARFSVCVFVRLAFSHFDDSKLNRGQMLYQASLAAIQKDPTPTAANCGRLRDVRSRAAAVRHSCVHPSASPACPETRWRASSTPSTPGKAAPGLLLAYLSRSQNPKVWKSLIRVSIWLVPAIGPPSPRCQRILISGFDRSELLLNRVRIVADDSAFSASWKAT